MINTHQTPQKLQVLAIDGSVLIELLRTMDGSTRIQFEGLPEACEVVSVKGHEYLPTINVLLTSEGFPEISPGVTIPHLNRVVFRKMPTNQLDAYDAPPESPADPHSAMQWESLCSRWMFYARSLENDICLLTSELATVQKIFHRDYLTEDDAARAAYEQGWREAMHLTRLKIHHPDRPRILDSRQEDD